MLALLPMVSEVKDKHMCPNLFVMFSFHITPKLAIQNKIRQILKSDKNIQTKVYMYAS